jgi:pyridoxal 5'-phosphate synthase pdxT subunit
MNKKITVGILALQGAFALHQTMLESLGVKTKLVKTRSDFDELDAIVIPGGESTVLNKLLDLSDLKEFLFEKILNGLFAFGTCAGLILLSQNKEILNCEVQRNAYGTQKDSFLATIKLIPNGKESNVAFIRAPKIIKFADGAESFASYNGEVVGVISNYAMGVTFHNEVTNDDILHRFFVDKIKQRLA